MGSTEKDLGRLAKKLAHSPNSKISTNELANLVESYFQEFLFNHTKNTIARWFLDQFTHFFFQMKAKTYIYVVGVAFDFRSKMLAQSKKNQIAIL